MACYAAKLGNCHGRITKEHYISQSVLEIAGKTIQIMGFPWQEPNKSKEVGINALTSNILCHHHNSLLSPIDEVGSKFLHALKSSFDQATTTEEFASEVFTVNGLELELWLLKILCGIFTTLGNVNVNDKWIEILFQKKPFPTGFGLYIFGKPGDAGWFFNLLSVINVRNKDGNIAAAKFGIGGLAFLLAFGKPTFHEDGIQSFYRPKSIKIKKEMNIKRIEFLWPEGSGVGSILLELKGLITDNENSNIRPIVMPYRKRNEKR